MVTVFTLNFLPYKPAGPVSSNIYRPTINSTGTNLKTILMTINSIHQNSKHDDIPNILGTCQLCIRPKKNICVFTVTCQKNLGSVGRHYYFFFFNYRQNRKYSCPVPESDSGISFSKFKVSRHLFYDELHSFSTFFALNFDKKLAVE